MDAEEWNTADWPTDPAERERYKARTFLARWSSIGGNLQQVPKSSDLIKKLFTEPDSKWQVIEFDSSDAGFGRETRAVVHKSAAPGFSLPPRQLPPRQVLTGGRRAGRQAAINAALAFAAGQALGQSHAVPALGQRRRTKVSAAVRSALEHWASAN